MEQNEFTKSMQRATDAELLDIVTVSRNDYQPEAIEAAEAELKVRNLSATEIERAEKIVKAKAEAIEARKDLPLQTRWKVLAFLFPAFGHWFIGYKLKEEGYTTRGKELWRFTLLGLGFYVILIIIVIAFVV